MDSTFTIWAWCIRCMDRTLNASLLDGWLLCTCGLTHDGNGRTA